MGSLTDYLDKGASLGRDAPCLVEGDRTLSYGDVQDLSHRVAGALARDGVEPGAKVGILSSNNAVAFACVFGIARRGAVWCPINPRNEIAENRALLELFDCECLIYHAAYAPMAEQLDMPAEGLPRRARRLARRARRTAAELVDDLAMLVGTGGTTGLPKGVMLTSRNLETMTALTLMGYPFSGRPRTSRSPRSPTPRACLCFPVMTQGGRIVVMPKPDVGEFIALIERERITHTFLPPTLIYMLLGHEAIGTTDLSSLQCFWYGAAPMSTARLEEALRVIGPMAQLFGQTEAPMMVSMLPPAEHYNADGTVATKRLASAGRPAPLVTVGIMDPERRLLRRRARRDRRARLARDGRLLQEPRGDRGRVQARLAPHGRHRLPRRGRLPVHRRSPQGHDHHRRLQRLLGRGRAGADAAPGGARLRGRRAARRQVGRAGHRGDRAERRGRSPTSWSRS
jgi:acyl-CoA synthetase (AMP-forming)/AMP-acid ligase II